MIVMTIMFYDTKRVKLILHILCFDKYKCFVIQNIPTTKPNNKRKTRISKVHVFQKTINLFYDHKMYYMM